MFGKALLGIAVAVVGIAAFALITMSDGPTFPAQPTPLIYPAAPGWDGRCEPPPGPCPAMPLRALLEKYPIRWCAGYTPNVYEALNYYYGWKESLSSIGVELDSQACDPYWLVSVWVIERYIGSPAAHASYSAPHWDKDRMWTAGVCTITINTRVTTNPANAIYWDKMSDYQRRSLVNHEFGHCLGLGDGEGGIMNQDYSTDRPTAANKELLKYRYPYSDPLWWRYVVEHR